MFFYREVIVKQYIINYYEFPEIVLVPIAMKNIYPYLYLYMFIFYIDICIKLCILYVFYKSVLKYSL